MTAIFFQVLFIFQNIATNIPWTCFSGILVPSDCDIAATLSADAFKYD